MKKRILSIVCALAIVLGMIIPWTGDVHAATTKCKCSATVTEWITLTDSTQMEPGKHYRLEWDVERKPMGLYNKTDAAAATYCLDLAGYTLLGSNRTIVMNNKDTHKGSLTLNIMDSSLEQTGKVMGHGIGSGSGAGVVYMYPNATLNLYGGTITTTDTSVATASYGGVINMWGMTALNLYGGKIIGSTAAVGGGAVYVPKNATLNMSGGSIVGGTAPKGRCVYAESGAIIKLSKNAKIEELYFENVAAAASSVTISGKYTGTTALNFTTAPAAGAQIAVCDNATVGRENITIVNPRMNGVQSGNKMVATVLSGASLKNKGHNVAYYDSLATAVANLQEGGTIKLLGNNSENVTIPGNATLDLFGWKLSGKINATGTLKLKDSATDDLIIGDTIGLGAVTGTITGNAEPAANYAAVKAADGTTSYHKYILKLNKVSLRPGSAGVYYSADFQLNPMLQEKLNNFGIAVSTVTEQPTLEDAASLHTVFGKASYGSATAKSALVTEFLDTNNSAQTNNSNAQTNVYGRPYFQYTDATGTHAVYGSAYGTNLKALTEKIAKEQSATLKLAQNRALTGMYETFYNTLKDWDLAYLHAAKAKKQTAADDNVLKVLVIGNSHGGDSTQLLADVFKTEGYAGYDDVVIGAMYIGGCQVYEHVKQIEGNLPYTWYSKHAGKNSNWVKYTKEATPEKTTLLYALEDENWDVVLLQEMNRVSAIPDTDTDGRFAFGNDDIETVYTYVVKNLGYEPYLMWNMIWTNPEIPVDYYEKIKNADPSIGIYKNSGTTGGTNSGDEYIDQETTVNPNPSQLPLNPEAEAAMQTWLFGRAKEPLSSHISWSQQYVKYWDNDSLKMYEATVENVEKYVIGKSELGITVDDVMPAATAVQYALERCGIPENGKLVMGGTDKAMYRDYTHMSDYGRLMVAYLWYAKLTGKTQITEVNYTEVPASMRASVFGNVKYNNAIDPYPLKLDQEQIAAVIASVNFALKNPLAGENLMTLN